MNEVEFLSEMKVEYLDHLGSDLEIARAAWVSTMGERAEEGDAQRVAGLINMLMRDRHGSPFEQGLIRFRVTAPIVVFREHHRHRIASYNEMSGRYIQLPPRFYIPPRHRPLVQEGKPGAYEYVQGSDELYEDTAKTFQYHAYDSWASYQAMLQDGVAKEVARMILPLNIMSTMVVAMNPRALMNFLSLRVRDDEYGKYKTFPMWEIEQVARDYEEVFAVIWPLTHKAFLKHGRVAP